MASKRNSIGLVAKAVTLAVLALTGAAIVFSIFYRIHILAADQLFQFDVLNGVIGVGITDFPNLSEATQSPEVYVSKNEDNSRLYFWHWRFSKGAPGFQLYFPLAPLFFLLGAIVLLPRIYSWVNKKLEPRKDFPQTRS